MLLFGGILRSYVKGGEQNLMAAQKDIAKYKQKLISAFLANPEIIEALHAVEITNPDDLVYTHIFPYLRNPNIQDESHCFITMSVDVPQVSTKNYFFKDMLLIINIVCYQEIMKTDYGSTRIDYLSGLIDEELNGRKDFGNIALELVSNVEGASSNGFCFRTMRFRSSETNRPSC
nr:MAG TPA: hypothetical protein [Caudoviricetes sp.]